MADIKQEFEDLYRQYYDLVYKFLLKNVGGNAELAEELTQETFFLIFLSLHRYRGECQIKTWMCKIALNVMYKYFKKNPKLPRLISCWKLLTRILLFLRKRNFLEKRR